jgi:PUA domain protein
MFKKISEVGNSVQLNKSELKSVKKSLVENFPGIECLLEDLLPKKKTIFKIKLRMQDKSEIIVVDDEIVCFSRYKKWVPTLKLLHAYPELGKKFKVDRGAIKFVLNGANIMCQGFTSAGGELGEAKKGDIIVIMAEDKEHALAIGELVMSSEEIRNINKDVGVENLHFIGDDLWKLKELKKKK